MSQSDLTAWTPGDVAVLTADMPYRNLYRGERMKILGEVNNFYGTPVIKVQKACYPVGEGSTFDVPVVYLKPMTAAQIIAERLEQADVPIILIPSSPRDQWTAPPSEMWEPHYETPPDSLQAVAQLWMGEIKTEQEVPE